MKIRPRCLRCVALGLVLSALIHGAAAAWWLQDRAPPTILPESRFVELDLSVFGPGPSEPPGGPAPAEPVPEPEAAQPETLAQAPEPEPVTEPPPVEELEPQPEPEEPTVSDVPPEPQAPPEPEPEASPIPEVQPPVPPPEKPKVVKRTPKKRPDHRVKRPKKEVERRAKKPKAAKPPTEVARADLGPKRTPSTHTSTRPASSGASTASTQSRGSGDPSAGRSARNAEAAYLAELQRAIARHQRFPNDARRKRQTGVTTLSFVVQRDGRIRQVRITKSSGNASLDEAAVKAMQRLSRFKPIPAAISRQEWPMRVPIRFDLR